MPLFAILIGPLLPDAALRREGLFEDLVHLLDMSPDTELIEGRVAQ